MKSTLEHLSANEKKALELFYDSPAHKALIKIRDLEVTGLAADALVAPDMEHLKFLKGQVTWANNLMKLIEEVHKSKKI